MAVFFWDIDTYRKYPAKDKEKFKYIYILYRREVKRTDLLTHLKTVNLMSWCINNSSYQELFSSEKQDFDYDFLTKETSLGDGGKMRAYPLFTYDPVRNVETFYIEFDQGCRHSSEKHNDGVEEHIFVLYGAIRLVLGDKEIDVSEKQAVRFRVDISHTYQNLSENGCAVYNTIFYPRH